MPISERPPLERARRKAYARLLPLLFTCYVIAYVDRANVAIAKLTMTKDLPGFDNAVIGFGAGIFFIGYFLLEIPGTLLVEKWSARKWISRIMISWGIIAALTAAVKTPVHFYTVRFFLGLAEAGFFPGVIVYLTHWFPARDRARALSWFLIATPIAQITSPKISNLMLKIGTDEVIDGVPVHHPELLGLEGWQWVYIAWGIPAVVLGVVVLLFLTDRPRQARWLDDEEREALESELERERARHRAGGHMTVLQALGHPKVLLLAAAYFFIVTGNYGVEFFMPSILERWYDLKLDALTWLVIIPPIGSLVGQLFIGWNSDRTREALGETIGDIPSGLYPGDYLVPVGEALAEEFGTTLRAMPEHQWMPIVKEKTIDAMMAMIREDLAALNVTHDVFFSERSLHAGNGAPIRTAINDLTFKGHVYKGVLPPPKGQLPEDWEDREQTLFRSTEVGDDIDRPLIKSDGSYTYFAADVAYFKDKFDRGFDEMIYVLGADHGGYVKRLEAVARAVSEGKSKLTVLLCQLVKLFRNGEPVKMSKRSGDFVTLRDVVDEVGRDPVRFMMLYRKNSEPLDFDFAKVTEQSKDNPVFYVQYAHARCMSVFRQAAEAFPDLDVAALDLAAAIDGNIADPSELQLLAKLAEYPRVIEGAALAHEPHRIAFYLYDLASAFHAHWNKGKEQPELRFVNDKNRELSIARLGLVHAVASVLKSGLSITGTAAPNEMR